MNVCSLKDTSEMHSAAILTAIIIIALSKKPNPVKGIAVWYAAKK